MKEALISIPRRGLKVIPPEETQQNITRARNGEVVSWSENEKLRLKLLVNCGILAKRYPTPDDGLKLMENVSHEWRDELLTMAQELTVEIARTWHEIAPHENIAVIIFGSVAKGLVKRPDFPDPSNIDMAAIGRINQEERDHLLDAIRPKREDIRQRILSRCPVVDTSEPNPGNAGVLVQDISKLKKDGYEPVRRYISSNAFALFDPSGIWSVLENEAMKSIKSNPDRGLAKT